MKNKILNVVIIVMIILTLCGISSYAASNVRLELVEDKVCNINLGEYGKVTKKLISVDDATKTAMLQIDVENLAKEETRYKDSEIYLVLDNSRSMEENNVSAGVTRKEAVFSAAKNLVNSILTAQSNTKIGVVRFSTDADHEGTLDDAQLVISATNSKDQIISAIDSIVADGARTNIEAGIKVAKNNITTNTNLNRYIILLTDGVPNTAVGGPTITYSGATTTKTKAELQSVVDAGINIVTVMTGVDSNYQPDASGALEPSAAGKSFKDLAEEIFGTQENPQYGKFYFISDENLEKTITEDVYSNVVEIVKTDISDIVLLDYFPQDIINNYNFEIVEQANIGEISSEVDTTNNSITWVISKLRAGEVATVKYKLTLKENFDEKIIDKITPTNEKVEVTYTDPLNETKKVESNDSPSIVLRAEKEKVIPPKDNTVAPKEIPQAGNNNIIVIASIAVVAIIGLVYIYKNKKLEF